MGAFLLYLNVIIIIEKALSGEVITMLKKLRNALFALTALLGITALFANTVQAAYDTPYLKGQVVLKLNWNSYVYDRYGNRMPWFNGLYGPLGYLKKGSYVYTTRKKVERTNKDVRYYFLHGTKIHTYEIDKNTGCLTGKSTATIFTTLAMEPILKPETFQRSTTILNIQMAKKP